ncbi:MAG: TrbC/VirB2 family protein [Alphaproteobacteria bacterium]|nr:TrbC/VirB2 family protein [Alphaproteobacteria bacterium]
MKFLKNNMYTLAAIAFVLVMAMSGDACAASGTVMDTARSKAIKVFQAVKTIVFVIGGFGLVGLAFQAIFGKVKWTWFAGLAVGLAILAAAGAIVDYATGDTSGGLQKELEDSFHSGTNM